jgi:hypothetical protein
MAWGSNFPTQPARRLALVGLRGYPVFCDPSARGSGAEQSRELLRRAKRPVSRTKPLTGGPNAAVQDQCSPRPSSSARSRRRAPHPPMGVSRRGEKAPRACITGSNAMSDFQNWIEPPSKPRKASNGGYKPLWERRRNLDELADLGVPQISPSAGVEVDRLQRTFALMAQVNTKGLRLTRRSENHF